MGLSFLWAVFTVFFALVSAAATNGQNAITSPLGGNLNAGRPVTITWKPTTSGTITLHILKGPPNNLVDLGLIIANVANSGTYTWTVPGTFEDSAKMPVGNKYGIKIIDDLTGTYEYSPPFDMTVPASAALTSSTHAVTSTRSTPVDTSTGSMPASTVTAVSPAVPTGVSAKGVVGAATDTNAASIMTIPSSSIATGLSSVPDFGLIFGIASAAIGAIIIIIVVAVVWARVRSDRKKDNYYGKSFRDRRSAFDAETPTTRHHSRSSSSSSFGDRRASQLFNYPRLQRLLSSRTLTRGSTRRGLSHRGAGVGRSSSPPPPMPSLVSIQLRNPPPPLPRGALQVMNNGLPHSPAPLSPAPLSPALQTPLAPMPAVLVPRAHPAPLNLSQGVQPYMPRVYTPIRPGFEDINL